MSPYVEPESERLPSSEHAGKYQRGALLATRAAKSPVRVTSVHVKSRHSQPDYHDCDKEVDYFYKIKMDNQRPTLL